MHLDAEPLWHCTRLRLMVRRNVLTSCLTLPSVDGSTCVLDSCETLDAFRSHAGRGPCSSVPANVLGKFSDVGLREKESILAVLVRRARHKPTIHASKCLVALTCKHVQQFRSRIRRICSAKQLHQNHRVVTLDSVYRPANSL